MCIALWEILSFVTLRIVYMHKKIHYTLKEKESINKHHMTPLKHTQNEPLKKQNKSQPNQNLLVFVSSIIFHMTTFI